MQSFRNEDLSALNSQTRHCPKCRLEVTESTLVCPQDGTPIFAAAGTILAETYEFLSVIGWGGMSIIYKARNRRSNQIVAIKMLHSLLLTEQSLKRFQQEADAISSLRHPNIISVHEFGLSDQGQPYMVMDYIEGENLSDVIQQKGCLSLEECLPRFIQICDALQHAHDIGILHRDIKPSNVMLSKNDSNFEDARIVDFGIAKLLDRGEDGSQQLTQTGELFGSPLYMSPEQCRGGKVDWRTDIYSMGCVMFETLTGVPPFRGTTMVETIMKQLNQAPPLLSDIRPDAQFSPKLENIIQKALAKNPADRFQTMNDLELALMQVKTEGQDTTGQMTRKVTPLADKRRVVYLVATVLLLGFLCTGGYCLWQNGVQYGLKHGPTVDRRRLVQAPNLIQTEKDRLALLDCWPRDRITDVFLTTNILRPDTNLFIEKLNLNGAYQVTNAGIKDIAEQHNLKEVALDGSKLDDNGVKILSSLPNLELISLCDTQISDYGLSYLTKEKKLATLYLNRTRLTSRCCADLAKISSLRSLFLDNTKIDDAGIALLKSLPLTRLSLRHTEISNAGAEDIAKMPTLTELILQDTNVTDAGLKDFKNLPKLNRLSLQENPISDVGARHIGNILALEHLFLDTSNITDKGLAALVPLKSLQELALERTLVTDAGMKELPKFQNLNTISLRNDAITDEGLDQIIAAPKLTAVNLDGAEITDQGLKKLQKDTKLNFLSITSCRLLHGDAIHAFELALPKCRVGDWREYDQNSESRFHVKKH